MSEDLTFKPDELPAGVEYSSKCQRNFEFMHSLIQDGIRCGITVGVNITRNAMNSYRCRVLLQYYDQCLEEFRFPEVVRVKEGDVFTIVC